MATLEEYITRLQQYNSLSILKTIIDDSWESWASSTKIDKEINNGNSYPFLLCSYGHNVAALVVAFGNPKSPWRVTKYDVYILLNEFNEIGESLTNENDNHATQILLQVQNSVFLKGHEDLLKHLDTKVCQTLSLNSFFSRLLYSQWSARSIYSRCFARSYILFIKFHTLLDDDQKEKIHNYFQMEPLTLCRSIYAVILCLLHNKNGLTSGIAGFGVDQLDGLESKELNITTDDIRLVVSRIYWEPEEINKFLNENIHWKESDAKYFLSPLSHKPLIRLDLPGINHLYVCPSPWMFTMKFQNVFSDYFLDIYDKKEKDQADTLRTLWGEAFHHIGKEVTLSLIDKDVELIDINEIEKSKKSKFADLLLYDTGHVLIVEFKTSVGNSDERSILNPEAVSKILLLQIAALKQCFYTQENLAKYLKDKPIKQVSSLVVSLQPEVNESSLIRALDQSTSYLKDLGLNSFDITDVDDYENMLAGHTIKNLVELIRLKTNKNRNHDYNGIRQIYNTKEKKQISYYKKIESEILPKPQSLINSKV